MSAQITIVKSGEKFDIWSEDVSMWQRYGDMRSRSKFEAIYRDFGDLHDGDFAVRNSDGTVTIPWYQDPERKVRSVRLHSLNNRTHWKHVLGLAQSQRLHGMCCEMGPPCYLLWTFPRHYPFEAASFGHRAVAAYHNFENFPQDEQVQQILAEGLRVRYIFSARSPRHIILWIKVWNNSLSGMTLAEGVFEWYSEFTELSDQFKTTAAAKLDSKSAAYKNSQLQFFIENGSSDGVRQYLKKSSDSGKSKAIINGGSVAPGATEQKHKLICDDYSYDRMTIVLSVANRLQVWNLLQKVRTYYGQHIVNVAEDPADAAPPAHVLADIFHKFKKASDEFVFNF